MSSRAWQYSWKLNQSVLTISDTKHGLNWIFFGYFTEIPNFGGSVKARAILLGSVELEENWLFSYLKQHGYPSDYYTSPLESISIKFYKNSGSNKKVETMLHFLCQCPFFAIKRCMFFGSNFLRCIMEFSKIRINVIELFILRSGWLPIGNIWYWTGLNCGFKLGLRSGLQRCPAVWPIISFLQKVWSPFKLSIQIHIWNT